MGPLLLPCPNRRTRQRSHFTPLQNGFSDRTYEGKRHREYKRAEGVKFSGKAFIRKLGECVGGDWDKKHVVIGEYDEENRSIDFDLTTVSFDL